MGVWMIVLRYQQTLLSPSNYRNPNSSSLCLTPALVWILEEGTKISIIRTFELCTTKLIIYMSDNILIYVMLIKLPSKVKLFGFNLHIALYTYTQSQKRKINITLLVLEFWLFDIQQQDQTIGNNWFRLQLLYICHFSDQLLW